MEEALHSIDQMLADMELPDPRFTQVTGKLNLHLKRHLAHYQRLDPAPSRVKTIPYSGPPSCCLYCFPPHNGHGPRHADLILIPFFYLLHPGEYTNSTVEYATPFLLQDVRIFCGPTKLNIYTDTIQRLQAATFCGLEFYTQKNGIKSEIIGLGRSGDTIWCPVHAVVHCILALRLCHTPPSTPLHAYKQTNR